MKTKLNLVEGSEKVRQIVRDVTGLEIAKGTYEINAFGMMVYYV